MAGCPSSTAATSVPGTASATRSLSDVMVACGKRVAILAPAAVPTPEQHLKQHQTSGPTGSADCTT
eukprot:11378220-Prorocentrum_lima.AAC.1